MHVHLDPPATPASVLLPRPRLVAGLALLFLSLATAAALSGGQTLLTWDEPIQRAVESSRTADLDQFFLTVSRLGSTLIVLALGGIGALLTWRRCPAVAVALVAATLTRPALEFVLKATVGRPRPDLHRMVDGTGYSFPSGHVMAAVALWGLLPTVVGLYTRRRALWWASVAVAGGLIASIAASRVYLGVHWFSDVTAGLVVGTFFLLGVETVFRRAHGRYPCGLVPCPDADAAAGAEAGPGTGADAAAGPEQVPDPATSPAPASTAGAVL
ncbi:MAG TPA: phosphatase PAP2 family protein [Acidimicrobiales bacterium]